MDTARAHALAVLAMLPTPGGTAGRYAAKAGQEARAHELHALGLSVREIAQQVGVHFTTVARWLRVEDG
jgi:predicted transposase YdaD